MGKNKSRAPRTQSTTFTLELYLDWDNITSILAHITKQKYWLILHNKDKFDDGSPKKPHVHVVVEYGSKRDLSSVKAEYKILGMEGRFIDTCNKRAMLRYLVHRDNPEKYQYSPDNVDTNDPRAFKEALADQMDASAQLHMLMDWIDSQPNNIKQSTLNRFALAHQCQGVLQRYWTSMIRPMILEHNAESQYRETEAYKKEVQATEEAMARLNIQKKTDVTSLPQLKAEKQLGISTSKVDVKVLNPDTRQYEVKESYFENDEVLESEGLIRKK